MTGRSYTHTPLWRMTFVPVAAQENNTGVKGRLKSRIALNGLAYGITQFYLPPDTSERAPP